MFDRVGWLLALLILLLAALGGGCGSEGDTGQSISRIVDGPCNGALVDSEDGGVGCAQ